MQRPGPVSSNTAALLLSSASLFDLFFVYVVTRLTVPLWTPFLAPLNGLVVAQYHGVIAFTALLGMYWLITELFLGGRSIGRGLLGLKMYDAKARPLSKPRRVKRALVKLGTLGLTGLNPVGAAGYDRAAQVQWVSPIAPPRKRPLEQWQIQFTTGSMRGKMASLGKITAFANHRRIRFGREKGWADVRLGPEDVTISNRHCSLIAHNGTLLLQDGDGHGRGSSNGTFLNGKRLPDSSTAAIGSADSFRIGDVIVEILR